jgi:hypothetical protein
MTQLILYTSEDGQAQVHLRADRGTVWLSQRHMAELFDVSPDNIGLHLKNIYADGELPREATAEESSVVQTEGGRAVRRAVTLYNLDAILAVGYRVRSPRGVQFRRWASTVLAEYLRKGFVMDDERLKNPDGRPDYFDEMLARQRRPDHRRHSTRGDERGRLPRLHAFLPLPPLSEGTRFAAGVTEGDKVDRPKAHNPFFTALRQTMGQQ